MEGKEITVCITSCGRFDLLERSIKSLVENWDGPKPKEVLIYEDSGPFQTQDFYRMWKGWIESLVEGFCSVQSFGNYSTKQGQIKGIDFLYNRVQTPYIFHCEDDWEFIKPGFIQQSLDILEEQPKIMQVWIRKPNDRNGHPAIGQVRECKSGTKWQMLSGNYRGQWNGFSWNPGLRRLADYKRVGPYSEITKFNPKDPLRSEIAVGRAYGKHGFRAATLCDGFCVHIGTNRHISG